MLPNLTPRKNSKKFIRDGVKNCSSTLYTMYEQGKQRQGYVGASSTNTFRQVQRSVRTKLQKHQRSHP